MENTKVKAIVIECKDYKENDKLISLLTVNNGIIHAILKGVKHNNAKLKLAKEIFCFGDFVLVGQSNYTVMSADVIDNFFEITSDYDRYKLACEALKAVKSIAQNESNPNIFINLLKYLNNQTYNKEANEIYIHNKFLIELLSQVGYKLNLSKCANCGGHFAVRAYLESNGELVCMACKSPYAIEIDKTVQSALRILSDTDYDLLKNLKLSSGSEQKVKDVLDYSINNLKKN